MVASLDGGVNRESNRRVQIDGVVQDFEWLAGVLASGDLNDVDILENHNVCMDIFEITAGDLCQLVDRSRGVLADQAEQLESFFSENGTSRVEAREKNAQISGPRQACFGELPGLDERGLGLGPRSNAYLKGSHGLFGRLFGNLQSVFPC